MAKFTLLHQAQLAGITVTTQLGVSVNHVVPIKIAQLVVLFLRSSTAKTVALMIGNIILAFVVARRDLAEYIKSWLDDIAYMWLAFRRIQISNLGQIVFGGVA